MTVSNLFVLCHPNKIPGSFPSIVGYSGKLTLAIKMASLQWPYRPVDLMSIVN